MVKKIYILIFAILLIHLIFTAPKLHAQSYRGPILDQLIFEIGEVDPGDVVSRRFTVTHDYQPLADGTDRVVTLYTYAQDIKLDLQGNRILLRKDEVAETARLSDWIDIDKKQFVLRERLQVEEVTVTIRIPEYAEPGGKYGVIWVSNRDGTSALEKLAEEQKSSVSVANGEIGIPILLTVSGNLNKEIEVERLFTTNIMGTEQSLFLDSHPVNAVVQFKNNGNVHVAPRGRVYFYSGENFAQDPFASFDLNPNELVVLPGSSRQFTFTWDDSFISTQIQKDADGRIVRDNKNTIQYYRKYDFDKLSKLRIGNFKVAVQYDFIDENGVAQPSKIITTSFTIFPWEIILLALITFFLVIIRIAWKKINNQVAYKTNRRK